MNHKRKISRKQKRVRHQSRKKAVRAARHLTLGDQHDIDRRAAEAVRMFPSVPRLKQTPFPLEREFGFAGHYIDGVFVVQAADAFVAMNVTYKEDAWYLRHDKRAGRKPRRKDTGIIETNVSVSCGLAHVLASFVEAGELKLAQNLAHSAGEAGMEELKRRTGYDSAFMALHPDAYGTLSFHFGLWPVDREKRCLIGRSEGGTRGRRGLRSLGHAFISILRHHGAIGLPENLIRRAEKNITHRDPDDWAVANAMDCKLRSELMKLPDGKQILERADEFQKAAAEEWLERFYTTAGGVELLKAERDDAVKKLRRRKVAAERLARMKSRRMEEQKLALEDQAKSDRQAADRMSNKVAEQTNAIKTALCHMGVDSEKAGSESCAVLVQKSEQVMKALNQAGQDLHAAQSELNERKTRLDAANERITGLESELKTLKKLATNLVDELRDKSVKLRRKAADFLSRLSELLGKRTDVEHGQGLTSMDDSMP
jgi:hypothetical protein